MKTNPLRLAAGLLLSCHPGLLPARAPSFIIILADDLGWSSLSSMMDQKRADSKSDFHQTPNIDRLAAQSMRFTSGYAAAAVCSPTRYSIQTGQSPARINHVKVGQPTGHIDHASLFSLARMIKAADPSYAAAHFGKWHIGCDPAAMGYDFSDGQTSNKEGGYKGGNTWLEVETREDPKLVSSLTDRSIRFLEERKAQNRPFFLQLSHYATHKEIVCTSGSYSRFEALPKGTKHQLSTFAAMLYDLDQSIGRLLDKVEALGLSDSTYIFFLSDNGGVPFFPPNSPEKNLRNGMGFNSPLQRGKWDLFEGGVRVPFMVRGPGIRPNTFCDVPVITWDILPTVAEIVQYPGRLPANLDGQSFKALLEGKTKATDRTFYFHRPYVGGAGLKPPHSAVRYGNYKLIKYLQSGQVQLYDLANDIGEQNDLSKRATAIASSLEAKLDGYLKSVGAISVEALEKGSPRKEME